MNVAFRVDASIESGTGHFMRCLTLADRLSAGGLAVIFLCRHLPSHLRDALSNRGFELVDLCRLPAVCPDSPETGQTAHAAWLGVTQSADAEACKHALHGRKVSWLVVDHYALDACWESSLRSAVGNILVIDDLADRRHDCDLLLDQNYYLDMPGRYESKVPPACKLLLGPRFALIRDKFRDLRAGVRPRRGPVARILVFFGGVDTANYTGQALGALAELRLGDVHVDVVLGAQHPCREAIERTCLLQRYSLHVQTERMAELMASADLAIGAGGTATWERCCLGLPVLAIGTAANQARQLADAAATGLVYSPDICSDTRDVLVRHLRALMDNGPLRHLISANGLAAVDGLGVERTAERMGCAQVAMRKARMDDCGRLHAWRNHPKVRSASRNAEPITWEEHANWFASVLQDPARSILIGELDGEPIGVVRFDIVGDQAEVSIYLTPDKESAVRGGALLHSAECWLAEHHPEVELIEAHVLGANMRSQGLFKAADYHVESVSFSKRLH